MFDKKLYFFQSGESKPVQLLIISMQGSFKWLHRDHLPTRCHESVCILRQRQGGASFGLMSVQFDQLHHEKKVELQLRDGQPTQNLAKKPFLTLNYATTVVDQHSRGIS